MTDAAELQHEAPAQPRRPEPAWTSFERVLLETATHHARRRRLHTPDGAIACWACGVVGADPLMLHCGRCLVARYAMNHPRSEWQLWPALERQLRDGPLDERACRDLVTQAGELPFAPPDWIRRLLNVVQGRFAPDPAEDWRTA